MIFCSWLHHLLGLDGGELCANQCVHSVLCTTMQTFLQEERFQEAKIHPSPMFLALGQMWNFTRVFLQAVICCSVVQSCLSLCDPLHCNTPGFPVHHRLLEFSQAHVHWVSNAIQPSHPLLSPSPPAFSLSQHQSLFQWVGSSHWIAKVLELQLRHQSFQWICRVDFL